METIAIARRSMRMLRGHKLTPDAMFVGTCFMLVEYDNNDEDDIGRSMVVNGVLPNPECVVITGPQLLAAITAYLERGWGASVSEALAERLVSYYSGRHSGTIYANNVDGSTLPVASFIVSGHPDGDDVRSVLLCDDDR